jgi:hypothetical protein
MVLRPFSTEITADDILARDTRHLLSCKRDFYVYDKMVSPVSTHGLSNNLYTGVVQSTKLLVKGFPNLPDVTYDRPENERTTLVKFMTVYNGYMNSLIKEPAVAFERATLKPIFTIATAYTDTDMINPFDGVKYPVQFAISIYSFETRVMSTITCNPAISYMRKNMNIIPSHQLDVSDSE